MKYCEDCGCAIYDGYCVNCHEDVYIADQHLELGTWNECSEEFKDNVLRLTNNPKESY